MCRTSHIPSSAPRAKPSGDHIPLTGFVRLNPATFHRDNGLIIWRARLEPQERSVTDAERRNRDVDPEAATYPVCGAFASAQGGSRRSSGGPACQAATRIEHSELTGRSSTTFAATMRRARQLWPVAWLALASSPLAGCSPLVGLPSSSSDGLLT